uniref:G-protein coupled receptors family 1 profile domain-containing protein n=1 Tax=Sus scrofa TaxID=9823 RepID=A0A8D1CWX2_PIG
MVVNIQTQSRVISYADCLTQMSIFILYGCLDSLLPTVMAYDRFVSIGHPLHYPVSMNTHLCCFLVLTSFWVSLLDSHVHHWIVIRLTCFKDVEITNFFCNPSQLLNLACSDIFTNNIIVYFAGGIFGFIPISGIFFSYCKILSSILRVPSLGQKYRPSPPVTLSWSYLLNLWNRPWGLPQLSHLSFSQEGCSGLSDVHCGHPHAEPLHLQSEEQKHQKDHGEVAQPNNLISVPVYIM